ncbi:hypothetical protein ACF08N_36405 [Streptomyces sp. NPDC015127]|uniref:hypothetical protein n=1 Tax=Streptomyces sp. NPDC015127 TaxID=3364939 RepID=UPI0036F92226
MSVTVTPGSRDDCTQAEAVIDRIRVTRPGPGRPRVRPDQAVADKGYSARSFRTYLPDAESRRPSPERADQLPGRRRRRERPYGFDKAVYRPRNDANAASTASSSRAASPPVTRNSPAAPSPPSPRPAHSSGSTHDRQDAT